MSALDSSLLNNTNTALYTDKTGCSNKIGMKQVYKGGGYGATMQSLQNDANSGAGYLTPSRVPYSSCDSNAQKGGHKNLGLSHPSLAETRFNHEATASYGFSAEGAADSQNFRGGYAPITRNAAGQQCGGRRRKKRKKSRRKLRKKSRRKSRRKLRRKSRRKLRKKSRRKSKRCLKCKGRCRCKGKCKCKSRKRKYRRRRRKTQKGGSSIFFSGVSDSLDNNSARLLGGDFRGSNDNCGDNYNHFNKSKGNTPTMY
tara:strand:+ start:116 stop:883 length:768 start_codon:yes stop_codon:yes gene_type:complete